VNIFEEARRERAYHEAGHAVVNAHVGLPFRSVTTNGVDFGLVYNLEECDQGLLVKLAKGNWAGCLTTAAYNKRHPDPFRPINPIEGQDDRQNLVAIGQVLNPEIATTEALRRETEALIETAEVWEVIEKIASLIVRDKAELSQAEVIEIVQRQKN
jgi:hypothetical protein